MSKYSSKLEVIIKLFNGLYFTFLLILSGHANSTVSLLFHGGVDIEYSRKSQQLTITTDTNNLLLDNLNSQTLDLQTVSLGRLDRLLLAGGNTCAMNRIKTTARERTSYFSEPLNLYLSMRLYFPATLQVPPALLNNDGQLTSLIGLFDAMPRKILGLTQDRSYGNEFDNMLVGIKEQNLFIRGGGDSFNSMVTLMEKGRFEFLLEYPETIKQTQKDLSKIVALKSLEVTGTKPYIVGHIECAKSPATKQFIQRANKVLSGLYQTKAFKQAHTLHLDKADIGRFNRYYQAVFLNK